MSVDINVFIKFLVISLIIFITNISFAADTKIHIIFSGLYYASYTKNYELSTTDNITNTTNQYTYTALGLWYEWNRFCLGIKNIENTSKQNIKLNTDNTNTNRTIYTTWYGLGISTGYFFTDSFFSYFNWYVQNDKTIITEIENSPTYKLIYYGGYAWSIDIGYEVDFNNIKVGPQISFIHFDFKKIKTSTNSQQNLQTIQTDNLLMPLILIGVSF